MRAKFLLINTLLVVLMINGSISKPNYQTSSYQSTSGLSPWAQTHINDVRRMADRMRQEFNMRSHNQNFGYSVPVLYSSSSSSSSFNYPSFGGKSNAELDEIAKQITEKMISDMKNGRLSYSQISQPNWFEEQAAYKLEALNKEDESFLHQNTQNILDFNTDIYNAKNYGAEVDHLNRYDQISHVTYPPSISIMGGKKYITHKNCTNVMTESEDGGGHSHYERSKLREERVSHYPNQVVIPVEENQYEHEGYENFISGNQMFVHNPGSQAKITINRMNRTIINEPGYQTVSGCRGTTLIVNGKVIYNYSQPIGSGSSSCQPSQPFYGEAEWKRKERERLFWLLAQGNLNNEEDLQRWQQQHWQKLTKLAQDYKITVEEIKEFQRNELRYYFSISNRFISSSEYFDEWKRKLKAVWDWLIQQNQIKIEELMKWQLDNYEKINNLAHFYRISIEELKNWQKTELQRFLNINQDNNMEQIIKIKECNSVTC